MYSIQQKIIILLLLFCTTNVFAQNRSRTKKSAETTASETKETPKASSKSSKNNEKAESKKTQSKEDTKDLNFSDTLKHYKKELSLDNKSALDRTVQQGKRKDLAKKKTPPEIKKKKGFIDTLIIKELDDDIKEDTIFKKDDRDNDINSKVKDINPLLLKNIRSIKRMAEKMNVPLSELIRALKNE
jgi:hypothetical protein